MTEKNIDWREDFRDLFTSPAPGTALILWLQAGKNAPSFLSLASHIPAGPLPWHGGSTLDHLARCMNETAGDSAAVWMAMCHDAGKLTTPKEMLPHHYGHESRGADLARAWAAELGLGKDLAEAGALAARLHMKAGRYGLLRPGKKLSLLEEVESSPCAAQFWQVVDADTKMGISIHIRNQWRIIKEQEAKGLDRDKLILLLKYLNSGAE